jgi:hypothetical protein
VSAHVYHQGDLDALLVEAVADLPAGSWSYLRHWDGGQHLRLRIRAPAEEVVARCRAFLAAHPSRHRLTDAEYAESAAKLAALEGTDQYNRALGPPDAVTFVPYESAPCEHDAESSRLALDLLRTQPEHRQTAALAQLLLAWFTAAPTAQLAALVAADATPPDPPRGLPLLWRAAVDRRYRAERDTLFAIAGRLRALTDRPADPDAGPFPAWLASLRRLDGADFAVLDRCAHLACNRLGVTLTEEGYLRMLAARTVLNLSGAAA